MNWLDKINYHKSFQYSMVNYQKFYESCYDIDSAKYPKYIIKRNKKISFKQFNVNMSDGNVISATYFENYTLQTDENTPVIVYFYGNSLSNKIPIHYINYCSSLSYKTDSVVIMINHLQPPKYKFPIAHNNAIEAVRWVKETCPYWQINSDKIYVAGDLFGANLGLSSILYLRKMQKNINIAGLIFTDPLIDTTLSSKSFEKFSKTPTISKQDIINYINEYVTYRSQIFDKRLRLSIEKDFTKFPPALIITSEFSPLRDDSYLLKEKLEECGANVFLYEQEKSYYGFLFTNKFNNDNTDTIVKAFIRNSDTDFLKLISNKFKYNKVYQD